MSTDDALPTLLRELRRQSGFTLREVEVKTEDVVSNAYLSQLEQGRRPTPNPRILTALAHAYGVPVRTLFEAAGYVDPPSADALEVAFQQVLADTSFRFGTRMSGDLTPDAKRLFVELYERATGKKLLSEEDFPLGGA